MRQDPIGTVFLAGPPAVSTPVDDEELPRTTAGGRSSGPGDQLFPPWGSPVLVDAFVRL